MDIVSEFANAFKNNQRNTALCALKSIDLSEVSFNDLLSLMKAEPLCNHLDIKIAEVFEPQPTTVSRNNRRGPGGKILLSYMDAVTKVLASWTQPLSSREIRPEAEKIIGVHISQKTHDRAMFNLTRGAKPAVLPLGSNKFRKYSLAKHA